MNERTNDLQMAAEDNSLDKLRANWQLAVEAAMCGHCDWRFLFPQGELPKRCPHCFQPSLAPLDAGEAAGLPYTQPPECYLPFSLSDSELSAAILSFAKDIPFAPVDLNPENLNRRLQRVYLPKWLVDADVRANWRAETGFDYQVVSHQERYAGGNWHSREVQEGRVRWEPRLGRLQRTYNNIPAPALESETRLETAVGRYDPAEALSYQPQALAGAAVRLPDRLPQDAWESARPAFQAAAAEECLQAAGADHIRQYAWNALYESQNWTLLLRPLYVTYYLDDENQPQRVLVHGRSGRLSGLRRASHKRAQRASLIVLAVAAALFFLSALIAAASLVAPPALAFGVLGLAISLVVGLGAVVPVGMAWWFNRSQSGKG